MRRSICLSEPATTRAGEMHTWKFHYTTAVALQKGAKLKFDLQSEGRDIDWETPSVNLKEKKNVIYAFLKDEQPIEAKEIVIQGSTVPQFEFTLPAAVKVGEQVTIVVGASPKVKEENLREFGNGAQLTLQRRRPFYLYVDPKGKGNYEDPEIFSLDIRGNQLHRINILTPSFVAKNKRFDITVRFEDEYGNLTNFAPEKTLIDLSYEHLRENLNWKLFVPETGFVVLPNLYFNEAGIYKIKLKNMEAANAFTSAPMKCFQENARNLFWGVVHGESERVNSSDNIESCLRYFRDERAVNFFTTSNFESDPNTTADTWKLISQNITDFNEEDRFAAFLGFHYVGDPGEEGVRQFIYAKDSKPLLKKKETKSNSLSKIYKSSNPKDFISIPSFTMAKGYHYNFKAFNPEFERVVEIYNCWGSSECSKKNGNPLPISGGVKETAEGSLVEALKSNHRFGFVAGGLDDRGIYAQFADKPQERYSPGMTGILCEKYTRDSMFDALYQRACYATTGPRIIIGFYIAGIPMGSELTTIKKQGLKVNRHISGYVAGTTNLKTVEVIRNGEVIHTFNPEGYHFDYYHDDMVPLSSVTLKAKDAHPFAFYYLRVTQEDGHIGWSSPIWVDHEQ